MNTLRLRFYDPTDPHFLPWDITVEVRSPRNVVVIGRHPYAGHRLLGFEQKAYDLVDGGVDIWDPEWTTKAINLSPVYMDGYNIFSVPGLRVESVEAIR